MAKRAMMVQLRYSPAVAAAASTAPRRFDAAATITIPGVDIDPTYAPVPLRELEPITPSADPVDLRTPIALNMALTRATFIVRAEIEDSDVDRVRARPEVVGVFSDPFIEPCLICPGSLPLGDDQDVEDLLCTSQMHKCGMYGSGVLDAVVDSGVNLVPEQQGQESELQRRLVLDVGVGYARQHARRPRDHVCIRRMHCRTEMHDPRHRATATNHHVSVCPASDAVKAYAHLLDIMLLPRRIGSSAAWS